MNELAAKYLATKYGFSVNSSFTAYGDLYDALRRGDISFALVDSSLLREALNRILKSSDYHNFLKTAGDGEPIS